MRRQCPLVVEVHETHLKRTNVDAHLTSLNEGVSEGEVQSGCGPVQEVVVERITVIPQK